MGGAGAVSPLDKAQEGCDVAHLRASCPKPNFSVERGATGSAARLQQRSDNRFWTVVAAAESSRGVRNAVGLGVPPSPSEPIGAGQARAWSAFFLVSLFFARWL